MYVILSAGVGGQDYTYGGSIVQEAEFPCSVFIDWVKVYQLDIAQGSKENENTFTFNINPNPAKDLLSIYIDKSENFTVNIINSSGRMLIHKKLNASSEIDIRNLSECSYIVFANDEKITFSKKNYNNKIKNR